MGVDKWLASSMNHLNVSQKMGKILDVDNLLLCKKLIKNSLHFRLSKNDKFVDLGVVNNA
jgi:hypothetical protein